jgi:RNA polymerase sigma-70 factor (ECF subfamily)
MEDRELAALCSRGDPSAWNELVRRTVDMVFGAVRSILGPQDAEDVVQSVYLKLMEQNGRRLAGFQGKSRISTWLVTIARREALDFARRIRRRAAAALPDSLTALQTEIGDPADEPSLGEAMARMPERDQLLLRLIYADGASYQQAAQIMSVPVNSLSPWLIRAKDRLRGLIQECRRK